MIPGKRCFGCVDMGIKEEIEIFRGEHIQEWVGALMDIPCVETNDPEKLCQHPVVSVCMITYNHEPYIRQAIEGVLMQKTDFEFELVIGEDASTDKTREICFEYQKKYPDKIRVLWWHENLYRNPHPAGGNGARNRARCRGEFIALCEGDDYWIDPLKLQKQVDVMRQHPEVSLCFCGAQIYRQATGVFTSWDEYGAISTGLIAKERFMLSNICGQDPYLGLGLDSFVATASALYRVSSYQHAARCWEVSKWRLRLGDVVLWLLLATEGDIYGLSDEVAVYRQTSTGACATLGNRLWLDNLLVRLYFFRKLYGLSYCSWPSGLRDNFILTLLRVLQRMDVKQCEHWVRQLTSCQEVNEIFRGCRYWFARRLLRHPNSKTLGRLNNIWMWLVLPPALDAHLASLYRKHMGDDMQLKPRRRKTCVDLMKSCVVACLGIRTVNRLRQLGKA